MQTTEGVLGTRVLRRGQSGNGLNRPRRLAGRPVL